MTVTHPANDLHPLMTRGRCFSCILVISDPSVPEEVKELENDAKARAPGVMARRCSWSGIGVGGSATRTGESIARQREMAMEAEVAALQAEVRLALADAKSREKDLEQAEARRKTLVAEAAHVSDDAADLIAGVMRGKLIKGMEPHPFHPMGPHPDPGL